MKNWRKKKTVIILLSYIFIYALIHEFGHSLAVIILGGTVTQFDPNPLNAHMNYNGNFTNIGYDFINIGGALLPWLLWLIFILLCPKKVNSTLEFVKLTASVMILGSMLSWMVIPLLYIANNPPIGDDVAKFLNCSKLSPVFVSIMALGLFLFSITVIILRTEKITLSRLKKIKSDVNSYQ